MLERQGAGDLEVIDHDLHSVEQALQRRASGGFMLDAVKVALVVAVLPLVLTLGLHYSRMRSTRTRLWWPRLAVACT